MRDIAVTLIVFIGCVYTLKKPYIGVLLWSWISYMNPHRLSYGFAFDMPFAQITAIVLFGAMLFSREVKKIPINFITAVWIFFIIFMGITTLNAFFPESAWIQYKKVVKIQIIVFVTMMLIADINKLNQLIWVICLSIGYFSVKGGIFTILSGGGFKVFGPPESFIGENNALAVAILMTIPLMIYLFKISQRKWVRRGLMVASILSFVCVLGSQSRGAFIAFSVVSVFFWVKSQHKLGVGILLVVFVFGLLVFMPESWNARMRTIETYDEDTSAMGRINAWEYAFNSANHNLLGMGMDSWSEQTFALYAPNPLDVHAAHSIYFSVLADHGWFGLIMFILILFTAYWKLRNIIKLTGHDPLLKDISFLAKMLQISFLAYLSGAAFLSLAYFDLPWHLFSFVVLLDKFYGHKMPITNRFKIKEV